MQRKITECNPVQRRKENTEGKKILLSLKKVRSILTRSFQLIFLDIFSLCKMFWTPVSFDLEQDSNNWCNVAYIHQRLRTKLTGAEYSRAPWRFCQRDVQLPLNQIQRKAVVLMLTFPEEMIQLPCYSWKSLQFVSSFATHSSLLASGWGCVQILKICSHGRNQHGHCVYSVSAKWILVRQSQTLANARTKNELKQKVRSVPATAVLRGESRSDHGHGRSSHVQPKQKTTYFRWPAE